MSLPHNSLYEFASFRLDAKNGLLWHDGEIISLKPKPLALLHLLVQHPGDLLTKQEIMEAIWPDAIVEEANLTQTMYLLRKALSQDGIPQTFIETVPKIGYRWVGEVSTAKIRERATTEPSVIPEQALATTTQSIAARVQAVPGQHSVQVLLPQIAPAQMLAIDESGIAEIEESAPTTPTAPVRPTHQIDTPSAWWRNQRVVWTVLGILVLIGSVAGTVFSRRSQGPLVKSIAILPFNTLGNVASDPALNVGLADALITRLGSQETLEVRPTAAVIRYSDHPTDPLLAGKQLGVEAVLMGHIHRVGEQMRLTVQLVRVGDGKTLWAHVFDEGAGNIFTLQDDLSQQVTEALHLPLDERPRDPMKDYGTANLAAWQLYQKGRFYWNKRQWTETKKAITMFEQALQLDPNYAQAYAGLADCYALWNPEMTPRERLAKAKPAAEQALALNDQLAEAHASLGFIKYKFEWDWRGSEVEFRRALALNPNYATAHHWYGESLSLSGQHVEALARLQEAERLNPLSFPIKEDIGLAFYRARNFDGAERKFREVLELDPTFFRVRRKLSDLLQEQGRYADAFQENVIFWNATKVPPDIIAALQQTFQQSGWQAFAHKELEFIAAGKLADDAHRCARLSLRANNREQALAWLEKSFDELGEAPLRLKEPEFEALQSDARFKALLQRAGHTL